jgi:hypothetical protein
MGKFMAKRYRPSNAILGEQKANCQAARFALVGQFPMADYSELLRFNGAVERDPGIDSICEVS